MTLTLEAPARPTDIPIDGVLVMAAHQLLAETLQLTMSLHGIVVEVGSTSVDGVLDDARVGSPRLVVFDLDLTGCRRGSEIVGLLAARGIAVLVLAGDCARLDQARCLEAGAVGVVSKGSSFDAVLDAVRCALEGYTVTPVGVRVAMLAELADHRRAEETSAARFEDLTRREQIVLGAIVDGHSAATIAERSYVSLSTVRTQIRSILQKLGVNSQLAAAALARNAGWAPTGAAV